MILPPIWGERAGWPRTPSFSQKHQRVHGLECGDKPWLQRGNGQVLSLEPSWAEARER